MAFITPSAVFLVSGGARGITAQCVVELARQFRCRFILLGRTALADEPAWAVGAAYADLQNRAIADMRTRGDKPTPALISKTVNGVVAQREIRHTIDAVEESGGQAVYLNADVTDAAALGAALQSIASFGAITGIIHGAGNLADKLIENKTEADFETVYAAKVAGLENMLAVVPGEQLAHLVLFSSVAGFYGNIGQADYAIANEILNKTAYQFKARYPACHVVSINWGPWDGGMVTPQLREYFDRLNIRVIPVEIGTRMLADELRMNGGAPAQIVIGSAIQPQPAPPAARLETYQLRRTLRLADSPFLADHVVNSKAVLPMVAAMSWMSSACEQIHPGYKLFAFDNYRVLKGIVFDDGLAESYTLDLKEVGKSADEIAIDAMVRSQNPEGKPRFHYSARITLRAKLPDAPTVEPPTEPPDAETISGAPFYHDGTLFHGWSFQGVDRLLRIDEGGIVMHCHLPPTDDAYQGQFPVQAFNYAMVDIGLQSIGIWSKRFYGMGSLPLRAAGGRYYRQGVFGAPFYVTMRVRAHSETNVIAGMTFYDEGGRVYLVIEDLEVTMSKNLSELFLKNRLPEPLV